MPGLGALVRMPTVAQKPANKSPASRPAVKNPPAPAARLVPPPGSSARKVMANYPAPFKAFDADGVERIVALRSDR